MSSPSASHKRIILTGASGVGKTALVEALAKHIDLPVIPEIGRQLCLELGYQQIGDIPDQEAFKRLVLQRQIETENKFGQFISDRSTIDCWVLWQRWNICSAMTHDTESFYRLARNQATKYTQVIYIPPMFAANEDGFRWTDKDYQKQIDRLVRMTLFEWDLTKHTYTVTSEGLTNRLAEVREQLRI